MASFLSDFDILTEAYPVHARREATATRPPRRESARFSNKRRKSVAIGGSHQRCHKKNGL